MRKIGKRLVILAVMVTAVLLGGLLADKNRLREDLIRLHVVGASDSREDQEVKLRVRDAVIQSLQDGLAELTDPEQAYAYVREMLPKLEQAANRVLELAGISGQARVTLGREAFPRRDYDTFSLPSGVYRSLRVVIGPGNGKNWWCVVFPQLCYGETSGFSDKLDGTITGKYQVRFWLLDQLGKLENFLFDASEQK